MTERREQKRRRRLEGQQLAGASLRLPFREMVDLLPTNVVILAPDYQVAYANRCFEERFGKAQGRRCFEYLFNRQAPCEHCATDGVLKTQQPHRWEWTGPDGRVYGVHDIPFKADDGSPLIMHVRQDITERKRAELALETAKETFEQRVTARTSELGEANAQLRWLVSLSELNPYPVVEVDLSTASVAYINPAARRLLPDLEREGLGHPWFAELRVLAEEMRTLGTAHVARRDVEVGGACYEQRLSLVPGCERLRVYAIEVTEFQRTAKALRASLDRYHGILEATGQVGWTTAATGMVVEDLPGWRKFTGQTNEEIRGWGWCTALHPDDRESAARVWSDSVKSKSCYETEYRVLRHDGVYRDFLARGIPVFSADGSVVEWVGTCVDITAHKRVEEAHREFESFFRQTLESIPGMVFTTQADGYCDYQSQQWVDFTGITISEQLGEEWNRLLHPEDQLRELAARRAAIEGGTPYDLECRVRRQDGDYEWFKVRVRPIRNSAGQVVRWFGTALNIDDLVQAQAALRRSERLYHAIGESIDFGIWVCAADGRNIYLSNSFLRLVGMTQEQCSGLGWSQFLHPDDAERTIAAWREHVRTGGVWDNEQLVRGVDGQWHPVLSRGVPVCDENGEVLCWAGINLDISRLKSVEKHLAVSLHEKEVLLQEIHHRVKNNLQIVSSLVSLQIDALGGAAARLHLEGLRDRVQSMALVHEKLYASTDLAHLDFAQYVRDLLKYLWSAHGADAAGIRLELEVEAAPLPVDAAVPCGLLLNELVSNALKHAFLNRSDGVVFVSLRFEVDGRVYLRVRDNGIGLPPDLDWDDVPSLGLRLTQMLAKQLGGTLEVRRARAGTEFELAFGRVRSAL